MIAEHKRKIMLRRKIENIMHEVMLVAVGSTLFAAGICATLAYWVVFGF